MLPVQHRCCCWRCYPQPLRKETRQRWRPLAERAPAVATVVLLDVPLQLPSLQFPGVQLSEHLRHRQSTPEPEPLQDEAVVHRCQPALHYLRQRFVPQAWQLVVPQLQRLLPQHVSAAESSVECRLSLQVAGPLPVLQRVRCSAQV